MRTTGFSPPFTKTSVRPSGFRISRLLGQGVPLLLAVFLSVSAVPSAVTSTVWAQTTETEQRSFNVAAGPLEDALNTFALQAGSTLSFDPALVAGKAVAELKGSYSVQAGFAALLADTGLEAVQHGDGSYGVRSVPVVDESGAIQLATMQVTANQLGEITEGTGSYTPGSIATATRLVLTPRETPQSISVITRNEMDDFQLNSIDKVMEHTPGVSIVTYDSERTVYFARGFAINNFQYDGIPMERDSGYSAGNTLSDMVIYDRIEVLKGATGLLTGSGDPGATINLIRKKPTHEFQGHVSIGAGSWNSYRGEADVAGPLNGAGTLRGRVVAAYQDSESHLDGYRRKTPVLYGILEADLSSSTLLTIGADYQDNKPTRSTWGGIPIYDTDGNFNKRSRSFNSGTKWSSWEQYTRTAFATLEHSFGNDWVTKLQLNHQINGYDAPLGAVGGGNPDPVDGSGTSMWVGRYVGKTRANAADFYASGPFDLFGRKHELVIGGSISNRRWTNKGDGPNVGYSTSVDNFYNWNGNVPQPNWNDPAAWHGENDETTRERGVYSTARWNLHDDLKFITGARISSYKRDSMKESGVVVPYLGLVYDLNDTYSVYSSYTGIFKPQSAQDAQGKTLDPLEGINYEAGVKSSFFSDRLNASFAYFILEQDNYAEATGGLTPSGGTAYRAISGVRTKGFEVEVSGQLTPRWQIHAGFNHNISRQQGDKVVTLAPENQFTLSTTYKPKFISGLTVGGSARWQDKTWGDVYNPAVDDMVKHTVDDYWLFDMMASYEISKNLSINLNVTNLFDKEYYTIFDWYSTYTWGEPRSTMLTMNYKF